MTTTVMHDPAAANDSGPAVTRGDTDAPAIPGYRFRRRLGRGGMATVYLATQESLDRPVSIKVMESGALADEVARQRFENEARTIARLSHPNIVAIHEVGRTGDSRPYYVMPYLGSGDLAQRDLSTDEARVVEVLRALLSALGYAHARGIVHRDVKRENVLFDADERPMLADFGIAVSRNDDIRLTSAGLAVGSSGYMAPEQARGDVVDGRADLYSVGVLAFELLTGGLPYRSNDALAVALMHAQDPVPRLPQDRRHWQAFVERAMAKSRDARYANAQEMSQALDRVAQGHGRLTNQVLQAVQEAGGGRWKELLVLCVGAGVLVVGLLFARDRWSHASLSPPPATGASIARTASGPLAIVTSTKATPPSTASSPATASPPDEVNSSASDAPATSDASSGDAAPSPASSSATKTQHARHAPPRRRPARRNVISRWWHSL